MRTTNPFLISVGIHLTLFALSIGALSVLHKTLPIPVEKIKLKILIPSSEPEISVPPAPIQPPQPAMKTVPPSPVPETQQPRVITPSKPPVITESKPIIPSFHPSVPLSVPPSVVKTQEVIPSAAPKAPPPPPPVKEDYKYPHKSNVESLLKQNIKCTKNMNRLKLRGTVVLSFDLMQNGDIVNTKINESSGNEILDASVEQQIKAIAPMFPKPEETVTFKKVPFEFKGCGN